jgi:hypothetical protein
LREVDLRKSRVSMKGISELFISIPKITLDHNNQHGGSREILFLLRIAMAIDFEVKAVSNSFIISFYTPPHHISPHLS